jgi:hypothetical protein
MLFWRTRPLVRPMLRRLVGDTDRLWPSPLRAPRFRTARIFRGSSHATATTTELRGKAGGIALRNGFGRTAYGGPCPPSGHGPHRYVFTLYAIDVPALDMHDRTRAEFNRALGTHTLATARLTGRYEGDAVIQAQR